MSSQVLPAPAQQLFRYLFEQASLGIAVEDLEGKILRANPALCSMLGYTEQELCTMSCSEFANPEDSQEDWAQFQQLRAGVIDHYSLEKRYIKKDGARIWGRLNVSLLKAGDGGSSPLVFAFVEEITERKFAEQELIRSNERFRLAVEAGKSVGWELDVKTGRDSWFGDLQTMFGIPSDTFVGRAEDFYGYVHPDDRQRVAKAVADARQTRKPYAAEFRVVRRDGMLRWVFGTGKFHYGTSGDAERMLGIATDITERKQAEEALSQKDKELADAQRLAGIGSWVWDARTDEVTWSKEVYLRIGRDPGLPAPRFREHANLFTAESWDRLQRAVEKAVQTGTPYELDLEILNPKSTARWLVTRGNPMRDAGGQIIGLRGTVQDITERKRAEEALHESKERFRLAAQAGKMFAYEWDVATDKIVRSEGGPQVLGPDAGAHTTGQEILTMVPPEDRARLIAAIAQLSPEEPHLRISHRMVRSDGSVIWIERTSRAYFDEHGRMLRIVGMIADITERKLAEAALSNVSRKLIEAQEQERIRIGRELHDDIGQRLALLAVELQQLREHRLVLPRVRSRVGKLQKQISEIANDTQSLSHELHSAKLQYLGLTAAMRGFCREFAQQQKAQIDFKAHDLPGPLSADISLCFFRVLQEALHNAVKHSGVRHFEVRLWGTSDELHLTVRDSGVGFDREAASAGQGLGLISMEERLKLVNGTLSIESQPKRGSTIHARAPVGRAIDSVRAAG